MMKLAINTAEKKYLKLAESELAREEISNIFINANNENYDIFLTNHIRPVLNEAKKIFKKYTCTSKDMKEKIHYLSCLFSCLKAAKFSDFCREIERSDESDLNKAWLHAFDKLSCNDLKSDVTFLDAIGINEFKSAMASIGHSVDVIRLSDSCYKIVANDTEKIYFDEKYMEITFSGISTPLDVRELSLLKISAAIFNYISFPMIMKLRPEKLTSLSII